LLRFSSLGRLTEPAMNDSPLRLVRLHPLELLLLTEAMAAEVAALRSAGVHGLADRHEARAAQIARAAE
jgi:hypothetical protein